MMGGGGLGVMVGMMVDGGVMSDGEEEMVVPGNVLSIFIHYFV